MLPESPQGPGGASEALPEPREDEGPAQSMDAAPELLEGVVVSHQANFYYVRLPDGREVACHLRGRLKKEGQTPQVGDQVRLVLAPLAPGEPIPPPRVGSLALPEDHGQGPKARTGGIMEILNRRNLLERPEVANVDQVLIVMAMASPPFSPEQLDRLLVHAELRELPAVVVLNKADLVDAEEVQEVVRTYEALGHRVVPTSTQPGGVAQLSPLLEGKLSVLAGPSGVGKSSLANALSPGLALAANQVSEKLQRGRHTTRHAALYVLPGLKDALLADTPGFSHLAIEGIEPRDLAWRFREFAPLASACKLPSCLHQEEPGCAVVAELGASVSEDRYWSYLKLLEEVEAWWREAKDRTSKDEGSVKRVGAGKRVVRVDAAEREGDRRTVKRRLERLVDEAILGEGDDEEGEAPFDPWASDGTEGT